MTCPPAQQVGIFLYKPIGFECQTIIDFNAKPYRLEDQGSTTWLLNNSPKISQRFAAFDAVPPFDST